jgi:hypothetical protein
MTERTLNLLRASICLIIAIGCFTLKAVGLADADAKYPYVSGIVALVLTIGYLKNAFDR